LDTFIAAAAGALLGDIVSFFIGYHYYRRIRSVWPFSRFPKVLEKSEVFFQRKGSMAIFISRFVGIMRPIMPFIAGTLRFNPWKFLWVETLSAALWAPVYMLPGILIGAASLHFAPHEAFHYLWIILLSIFILWLITLLIRLSAGFIVTLWFKLCKHLWQGMRSRNSFLFRLLSEDLDKKNPRPLSVFLMTLLTAILFLLLAFFIHHHNLSLISLNEATLTFVGSFHTAFGEYIALFITTYFGDSNVLLPAFGLMGIYLWFRGNKEVAGWLFFLLIMDFCLTTLLKKLIGFDRPAVVILPPHTGSFPSGHTLLATTLFGYLTFLLSYNRSAFFKKTAYGIWLLLVLLVAGSRLYLNVHWLSDITGSFLLGITLLGIAILGYRHHRLFDMEHRVSLLIGTLLLIVLFGSIDMHRNFKSEFEQYQFKHSTQIIDSNTWWNGNVRLPVSLINRFNQPSELLNLEWQDSIDHIQAVLIKQGFNIALPFGWDSVKKQLLGENIDLVSPFDEKYQQMPAALILTKPFDNNPNNFLIIRLWESGFEDKNGLPIYIGNIRYHFSKPNWLLKKECETHYPPAIEVLYKALNPKNFQWILPSEPVSQSLPACIDSSNQILLLR
jgi:membrane-associated phospholipid phosphatase